ncbi:MAG: zinc ribbon domain-containing protein [Bacteroidetes bacterium]|nr:zinc ribbon domain-containing protein [Bacteroidota bacterium]
MICTQCNTDNIRGASTCIYCNAKLPGIRHSCGFMNTITDQFCGGCGEHLVIQKSALRPAAVETSFQIASSFTDQQLVLLLEMQKQIVGEKRKQIVSKQEDIDKLFE